MSKLSDELKKAVGLFGKESVFMFDALIVSVDESKRTCTVKPISGVTSSGNIENVKLSAEQNDGVIYIPEVDSTVKVLYTNKQDFSIVQFSELAKALFIDMDIELNGSDKGGLLINTEVLSALNEIKSSLNTLKQLLGGWIVATGDGGAALKTILASWISQPIAGKTITEITNDKVKHGS